MDLRPLVITPDLLGLIAEIDELFFVTPDKQEVADYAEIMGAVFE